MRKLLVAAVAALGLAACSDPMGGGSGRTKVLLTDAPALMGNLAHVDVYVAKIEANTSTDTTGASGGGGWVTIAEPQQAYDLLALQQGNTALAGEVDLPAGQYRAIRVTINTSLSHVTNTSGGAVTVQWPVSGELVLNALVENPLEVPAGGAQIVIDFDVGRTFVDNGSGGLFFIPWIRAVNDAETGSIAGTVTGPDIEGNPAPVPNAYVIVSHHVGMGALGAIAATTITDADGHYVIGWLHAGDYSIGVQAPGGYAYNQGGQAITVSTGQRTTTNFTLTRSTGTDTTGTGGGGTGPVATVEVRVWQTFAPTDSVGAYAELRNSNGALLYGRTCSWTVGDPTVGTIVWTGGQSVLVRGLKAGTTSLTATCEGKSASAQITLAAGNGGGTTTGSIASISINPPSFNLAVGDSMGAYAVLKDSAGNNITLSGVNVNFTVADTTVVRAMGTFGQNFIMRALKAGSTTLTASISGKSANAAITVH